MLGIFFAFFWSAVATGYFSHETVRYGRRAIGVMREVLAIRLAYLPGMINMSFGISQGLVVVLICILGVVYSFLARRDPGRHATPSVGVSFGIALLCIAAGGWLWLVALGAGEIRYFFPFGFMALTALVPVAQFVAGQLPPRGTVAMTLIVVLLVTNTAALLVYPSPSFDWQRRSGVSLLVNGYKAETGQAKQLLAEAGARDGRAVLYLFMNSVAVQVIGSYANYARLADLTSPVLESRLTYDWVNGFGVHTSHLLDSNYIVFEPILDSAQRAALLSLQRVNDFDQEEKLFRAWLSPHAAAAGVPLGPQLPRVRRVPTKTASAVAALESLASRRSEASRSMVPLDRLPDPGGLGTQPHVNRRR